MQSEWLYGTREWTIYVLSIVILLGCDEVGYRVGLRFHAREKSITLPLISALRASTLGLLSLLIGFTFSMALTRFEARKALVLEEANAIGTTSLRARLLPEPYATEARRLLRTYVDVRLSFERNSTDKEKLDPAIEESLNLHEQLWRQATAASALQPLSVPTGLFVQALNETIDLHEKRLSSLRSHVPEASFLLIYLIAFVGLGFTGYDCGLHETRHRLPNAVISVLIASVIITIVDFDRPLNGLITVSDQPLVDLQKSLASEPK
jgi:hypothetical protein